MRTLLLRVYQNATASFILDPEFIGFNSQKLFTFVLALYVIHVI